MKLLLTQELIEKIKGDPSLDELCEFALIGKQFNAPLEESRGLLREVVKANGGSYVYNGHTFTVKTENKGRRITDSAKAAEKLTDLPDEVYWTLVEFSAPEIEKALAKHLDIPQKSTKKHDARAEYASRFGAVTEQSTADVLRVS